MREILFRGKCVDKRERAGEWIYGYYFFATSSAGSIHAIVTPATDPDKATRTLEVDPATVGQYTGLNDKDGERIFEGDIVKTTALSNDHHQRGAIIVSPVEYWCGNVCLSITYVPLYPLCVDHIVEIIGNIHDNPELLREATT